MSAAITQEQIKDFVAAWYRALDNHDPIEGMYDLLADSDLNVQFPDGDIRDHASFKVWYDRVINLWFDEDHYVQAVAATIAGEEATVEIVVGWQARWWEPPAAKSQRLSMDVTQRWTVRRSSKNRYGLEIVTYDGTAAPATFAPGFPRRTLSI